MILVIKAHKYTDPLYKAFCEYEQLKIFIRMNLNYESKLMKSPFDEYMKTLRII